MKKFLIITLIFIMSINNLCYSKNVELNIAKFTKADIQAISDYSILDTYVNIDTDLINSTNFIDDLKITKEKASKLSSSDNIFIDKFNNFKQLGLNIWSISKDNNEYIFNCNKPYSSIGKSLAYSPEFLNSKIKELNFRASYLGTMHNGIVFNLTKNNDGTLNGYMFNLCMHCVGDKYNVNYGGGNSGYINCLWKFSNLSEKNFTGYVEQNSCTEYISCEPNGIPSTQTQENAGNTFELKRKVLWKRGAKVTIGKETIENLAVWRSQPERINVNYKVISDEGQINIYDNGLNVCSIQDNTYKYGTFGFYGYNCEQTQGAKLTTFTIDQKIPISFAELLKNFTWRNNTIKVILNILQKNEDNVIIEAKDISNILNNEINILSWITEDNYNQVKKLNNILDVPKDKLAITYYTIDGIN